MEDEAKTGPVQTTELDLNGDGVLEVIVELPASRSVRTGGSLFYVFVKETHSYRIHIVQPASRVETLSTRQHGFRDLLFRQASVCSIFRSTGNSYQRHDSFNCKDSSQNYLAEREQCLLASGSWEPQNRAGIYGCVVATNDGGKECKDSSECERWCLYRGQPPSDRESPITGLCVANNRRWGCGGERLVVNGKLSAGVVVCAD
jgi:hypothetical protein